MLTLYTVITGGYDKPAPVPTMRGVRCVMVTDGDGAPGWEVIRPKWDGDVRRMSRHAKCAPHLYFDAERSIYMDGAFAVRADPSWLRLYVDQHDLAAFAHHGGHKSHHDERNFYQRLHGYVPKDVEAHYRRLCANQVRDDGRFWACGVIVRKHSPAVDAFGETWWNNYITGSQNDQLAFAESLHQHPNITVRAVPGANVQQHDFPWRFHGKSK